MSNEIESLRAALEAERQRADDAAREIRYVNGLIEALWNVDRASSRASCAFCDAIEALRSWQQWGSPIVTES